eukprot:3864364-Pleurochrysis_carterae.AAC.1
MVRCVRPSALQANELFRIVTCVPFCCPQVRRLAAAERDGLSKLVGQRAEADAARAETAAARAQHDAAATEAASLRELLAEARAALAKERASAEAAAAEAAAETARAAQSVEAEANEWRGRCERAEAELGRVRRELDRAAHAARVAAAREQQAWRSRCPPPPAPTPPCFARSLCTRGPRRPCWSKRVSLS